MSLYYIVVSDKLNCRFADKAKTEQEALFALHIFRKRGAKEVAIYRQPFHSTTDEKALVAFCGDGSYWDNVSKKNESVEKKRVIESIGATRIKG